MRGLLVGPIGKGIVFGVLIGGVMRLPGKDTLLDAFAANLSVMTALWLGTLLVNAVSRRVLFQECGVAVASFALAAAAFQGYAPFLTIGFLVQAIWCVLHMRGAGVVTQPWFPPFAACVNVTFGVTYVALELLT